MAENERFYDVIPSPRHAAPDLVSPMPVYSEVAMPGEFPSYDRLTELPQSRVAEPLSDMSNGMPRDRKWTGSTTSLNYCVNDKQKRGFGTAYKWRSHCHHGHGVCFQYTGMTNHANGGTFTVNRRMTTAELASKLKEIEERRRLMIKAHDPVTDDELNAFSQDLTSSTRIIGKLFKDAHHGHDTPENPSFSMSVYRSELVRGPLLSSVFQQDNQQDIQNEVF